MRHILTHRIAWIGAGSIACAGLATRAENLELIRYTIAGGSAFSRGGELGLASTIGQAGVGSLSGGPFTLSAGYELALVSGDCNADGSLDLLDYERLAACLSGPNGSAPGPACDCEDLDATGAVDLRDFARLQTNLNGR